MSFIVRNLTAGAIVLNDLGLEIAAGADYDMLDESAQDVQASGQTGGDLNTEVNAGNLIVLNPKDGITQLSQSDSITVIQVHNDPNWGIRGAEIKDLDGVLLSPLSDRDILIYDAANAVWINTTHSIENSQIDGGSSLSTYLIMQNVEGGNSNSIYSLSNSLNGGGA